MKTAYIMRGLPGSGKSTITGDLITDEAGEICSTDDYFMDGNGVYRFNPALLKDYHKENQGRFANYCEQGRTTVICDNTNMTRWEVENYASIARKYGYNVVEVLVGDPTDPEHQKVCAERNKHGVSLEVIQKMAKKFQR